MEKKELKGDEILLRRTSYIFISGEQYFFLEVRTREVEF